MIVVTYIYQDFEDGTSSTYQFRESCKLNGLPLHNVAPGNTHVGNGEVLRLLGRFYASLPPDELVIYSDGADSVFLARPEIHPYHILYSTEQGIWPPREAAPALAVKWDAHPKRSPWCYLNGGGYCGPAGLLAEFFQRYLMSHPADANGQWQQAEAYFQACLDGFPIELDQQCETFQTIGFSSPDRDFRILPGVIINNYTNTTPAVIHGNGRTSMQWVYDCLAQAVNA